MRTFILICLSCLLHLPAWADDTTQSTQQTYPPHTILQSNQPAAILSIEPSTSTPKQMQLLEYKLTVLGQYQNPFDPNDVAIDAIFTHQSGQTFTIPAFFMVGFDHQLVDGYEKPTYNQTHGWRLRFRPPLPGHYTATFTINDNHTTNTKTIAPFTVQPKPSKGFIRISPTNPLIFAHDNGSPFIPIGMNVCWASHRGVFDYGHYWQKLAENKANYARIWLAPTFNGLSLQRPKESIRPTTGHDRIDQLAASRLDYILNLAEQKNIYLMLCIESYNSLNQIPKAFGCWDIFAYNSEHGGPIDSPEQFWTNPEAQRLFELRLRYLIARFGHSPNVFAWELWNEVEGTENWYELQELSYAWHKRMAAYLKQHDPYQHLVTTSAHEGIDPYQHYKLKDIDFTQTHNYASRAMAPTVRQIAKQQITKFNKPHLMGEMGIAHSDKETSKDTAALHFRNMLWAGLFTDTPSTAMTWWWNNYIDPNDLWHNLSPVTHFMSNVPVNHPDAKGLTHHTPAFLTQPQLPIAEFIHLKGDQAYWSPTPSNTPTTITIDKLSIQGLDKLSRVLHTTNEDRNPVLANPLTININYETPGQFAVNVHTVSGWGGAKLKVYLDDQLMIDQDFVDKDGTENTQTLEQYAGQYSFDVPIGQHKIYVENDGADWLTVDYQIISPWIRTQPWYEVHGRVYPSAAGSQPTVTAWLLSNDATWSNAVNKRPIHTLPETSLTLTNIPNGHYEFILYSTLKPTTMSLGHVTAQNNQVTLAIPPFLMSTAFQLIPQPATPH